MEFIEKFEQIERFRPDFLDNLDSLNYLENQIEGSKELITSNQLTAIL